MKPAAAFADFRRILRITFDMTTSPMETQRSRHGFDARKSATFRTNYGRVIILKRLFERIMRVDDHPDWKLRSVFRIKIPSAEENYFEWELRVA